MKIAIIGAGFTGLSAAFELVKNGHEVAVFEKGAKPGGLAIGYKKKGWKWTVEEHYHHWFTNDKTVLDLAREINYPVIVKRPKTSTFIKGGVYQLDSPFTLINFPLLNFIEKIRMGLALGFLKFSPFLKIFDKYKANEILLKIMGKKGYEMVWSPLLKGKFGDLAKDISLAWFWARIKKRTPSLVYPQGGFLEFSEALEEKIQEKGGKFYYNTEVSKIKFQKSKIKIGAQNSKIEKNEFDSLIVTLPSFLFLKIVPELPLDYKSKLASLKSLGAINLILRLKKQFLIDGTYWLNICERKNPLMAVVEHTNFMDKKYYNNEHIVYIGNYLPFDHPYMQMAADELLKIYDPFLKKINPNYKQYVISYEVFKAPFAQPVMEVGYGKIIPPFKTPIKNVYLANIDQIYPWDRGTNYAVELGQKVAKIVI